MSARAAGTRAEVSRIPLVCLVQSAILASLAWAERLAGARAAGARAAGTRIRDDGGDSAGDGRVACQWCAVLLEGGKIA